MKTRQMLLTSVAMAAAIAASTACESGGGSTPSGSVSASFGATPSGTLKAWAFDNADDVGNARLNYAKQQLAGVSIKLDQTSFDAQKFTTRLAGGNVPDVVQMDRQYVATYAAQGLILPLDKCYADNKVDPKQRFYQAVVNDVTYKGQVWAVPQFFQPPAIILNKTVMDAAGVTNDQIDTSKPDALLAAIAKMYKASGGVPTTLGFNPVLSGQPYLWVVGLGGQLIGPDGKPTLDNPNNVYPLELLKRITDAQGGYAKVKSFSDSFDVFGAKNQFVKNQVGAEVDAQWYPNVLAPFQNKIKIEAVPFKDKNGQPVSTSSGTSFVIPAKAANPVAACKWMLDLTAPGSWDAAEQARVQTLAKNKGVNTGLFTGSPDSDKAIRSKYVKPSGNAGFDQVISTYYDVLTGGKSVGASPAGQAIQADLINAMTATALGQKSAQKALSDAQAEAMRAYNNTTH